MQPLLLRIPELLGISIEVYFIALILAIPFFFLWRRVFRRFLESRLVLALAAWAVAVITAPVVYVLLMFALFAVVSYYPKRDFDKSKWLATKENRYEFSDDIISSKILLGKTKSEVRQLLGKDENVDYNSDYWRYYLGYKPAIIGIDPDVLDIQFENGVVVSVEQHQT